MLKIYKCFKLPKNSPQKFTCLSRYFNSGDCPKYDCKRPPEIDEDEEDMKSLREMKKPLVFECRPHKDIKTLKAIFYFLCLPVILCAFVNIFYLTEEHFERPKFLELEYLRIRNKPYPWHPVRSLFHDPKRNALPEIGYEEPVPEEEEYNPIDRASDRWFYRGKMV